APFLAHVLRPALRVEARNLVCEHADFLGPEERGEEEIAVAFEGGDLVGRELHGRSCSRSSGVSTAFSVASILPPRSREANHQMEPLRTAAAPSSPRRSTEATSPSVGWWPTTSTERSDRGQSASARTPRALADSPTDSLTSYSRSSGFTVCSAR